MRIFRLIATPVILLGLLALLIWGASWGWKALTEPLPSPSPTPCVVEEAELVNVTHVSVRIFNGGFTSGLANREARRLTEVGFKVIRVDNTDERIRGTVIRANENQTGQIRLVKSYFLEPTVEYDDRIDGTVDIYLGTDFLGANDGSDPANPPLFQVSAPDGQICVVPEPSPSPSPSLSGSPSPTAAETP